MRFTVLQIRKDLRNDQRAFEASVCGNVDKMFFLEAYEEVCEIEANDLDEVFEVGNIGPESKIKRYTRMHSVSVGDVIQTEKNQLFVVKGFGFERLGA